MGLLGVLLTVVGLLLLNSAVKDLKAMTSSSLLKEIEISWGLIAAGIVALASLGTSIGSHEA